jgi:hypothetical protein
MVGFGQIARHVSHGRDPFIVVAGREHFWDVGNRYCASLKNADSPPTELN